MRLLATFLALAIVHAPHQPQKTVEADITGYYAVDGKEPSGKFYSGVASITKINDIYVVQWTTGGTVATGVGQRNGKSFSVGWSIQGGPTGCTVYTIGADGKEMSGTYVMLMSKGVTLPLPETLSLLRRMPKPIKGDI